MIIRQLADYVAEHRNTRTTPPKVLADVFWGLSNAIADGRTDGLRRLLMDTCLVESALHFAVSSSKRTTQLVHETAVFVASLATPPQVNSAYSSLLGMLCKMLH